MRALSRTHTCNKYAIYFLTLLCRRYIRFEVRESFAALYSVNAWTDFNQFNTRVYFAHVSGWFQQFG